MRKLYAALGYDPVPADPEGAQRLKEAERAVRDMERAWQDAESGTDRERAAEDLADAREELADAKAADGPMVPASEIVFLPELPARVDAVEAAVGAAPGGTLLSVSVGELVVRGALTAADKGLVRKGQKADILSELTGTTATGKVTSVADRLSTPDAASKGEGADAAEQPAVAGAGAAGYAVVVTPDRPLPGDLVHQGVRLTIKAAPAVFIGGRPFTVIGIVDDVDRKEELLLSVTVPSSTAMAHWGGPARGGEGEDAHLHTAGSRHTGRPERRDRPRPRPSRTLQGDTAP